MNPMYAEDLFYDLLSDEIFEIATDMKWLLATQQLSADTSFGLQPLPGTDRVQLEGFDFSGYTTSNTLPSSSSSTFGSRTIVCNVCGKDMAGSRYAPHLERCMSGGKRSGVRRHTDNLLEDTKKVKKEFQVDPYPNSMIVRIKMKGDVPVAKQQRIGVSIEEFRALKPV